VDVLKAGADHLETLRFPESRAQRRDDAPGFGSAFLAGHAVLDPADDGDTSIRPADLAGRADVDKFAARDDADAVAELRGLVEVVGCEEDRGAVVFEAADDIPELAAG